MTMPARSPQARLSKSTPIRIPLAGLLGVAAALLVSCGSSGGSLIPTGNAGPLQADFEAVAQAAQAGNGNCSGTETAIAKTEQDFGALPATVNAGLRNTLHKGIANLRNRALAVCLQPLQQTTATSTSPKVTTRPQTTPITPTVTHTTPTQTTPTTTTPTTSSPGGGTPAPGAGGQEASPGAPSGPGSGGAGESPERSGGAGASPGNQGSGK
jgi:hypothetical protein